MSWFQTDLWLTKWTLSLLTTPWTLLLMTASLCSENNQVRWIQFALTWVRSRYRQITHPQAYLQTLCLCLCLYLYLYLCLWRCMSGTCIIICIRPMQSLPCTSGRFKKYSINASMAPTLSRRTAKSRQPTVACSLMVRTLGWTQEISMDNV